MTNKEKLLEEKIVTLEQRLVLVERFVELRFSETFRDFSIRNTGNTKKPSGGGGSRPGPSSQVPPGNDDDDDDDTAKNKTPIKRASRQIVIAKGSTQSGPASAKTPSSTGKKALKDCVVRVTKLNAPDTPAAGNDTRRRYGTRRQTQLSQQSQSITPDVKLEVSTANESDEGTSFCEDDFAEDSEDQVEETAEEEGSNARIDESYFTFPSDQNDADNDELDDSGDPLDVAGNDNDEDWNGESDYDAEGADNRDDADVKTKHGEIKRKGTLKRKMPYTGKPRGRKKKDPSEPKKKRYYLTSIAALSEDAKIHSTDSSRAECPVCKQYWKIEFLEKHIATHMRERHLKCPKCDNRYSKTDDLRTHMKMKHERDKYFPKCRICFAPIVRKMIFHERYCVKKTLQSGKDVDESLVEDIRQKCAEAGLEFVLPNEAVPPGVDPTEKVECPICVKSFQRRVYDRHVKMHSLARNWRCTKCPKAYIHKHDLIRHMVSTHETTNKCEYCGGCFETRQELYDHKRGTCLKKSTPRKGGMKSEPASSVPMIKQVVGDVETIDQVETEDGEESILPPAMIVEHEVSADGELQEEIVVEDSVEGEQIP